MAAMNLCLTQETQTYKEHRTHTVMIFIMYNTKLIVQKLVETRSSP